MLLGVWINVLFTYSVSRSVCMKGSATYTIRRERRWRKNSMSTRRDLPIMRNYEKVRWPCGLKHLPLPIQKFEKFLHFVSSIYFNTLVEDSMYSINLFTKLLVSWDRCQHKPYRGWISGTPMYIVSTQQWYNNTASTRKRARLKEYVVKRNDRYNELNGCREVWDSKSLRNQYRKKS